MQTVSAAESSRDFLQIPPHRASADTVLRWEVFGNKYPENALIGNLFKDSAGSFHNNLVTTNTSITPLEDEQIPMLIDRFLQNVHTKNPILDVEALVKHGRQCAERGIGWDARSCLVLMACALGSVAKPFSRPMPPDSHVYDRRHVSTSTPSTARLHAKELEQGDSCFTLACRRLGSLKYSMLSAQCYFFAGGMYPAHCKFCRVCKLTMEITVYLMYTLRPLDSWHYFLHASIFFQVHLKTAHGVGGNFEEVLSTHHHTGSSTARKMKRLEQSLYWSCFKSECEFRVELPLNQSEISLGEYPDLFPSPPSPISTPSDGHSGSGSSYQDNEELELRRHAVRLCNEEESWYYYLTEIALRRIGNRIVNTFFRQHRTSWLTGIKPLLHMAREFEAQVSSWSAHLPPAMQRYETTSVIRAPHLSFQNERDPSHVSRELSWAVDNRILEMQTWLYQPFLYYMIHSDTFTNSAPTPGSISQASIDHLLNPSTGRSAQLTDDDMQVLRSLVVSGIECCIKTIEVRCRGHRHHGLWFDLRSIMAASLILLALVKSRHSDWIPGGEDALWGPMPTDSWADDVPPIGGMMATVLTQFAFWEAEAPDMAQYRKLLESVIRDVRGS